MRQKGKGSPFHSKDPITGQPYEESKFRVRRDPKTSSLPQLGPLKTTEARRTMLDVQNAKVKQPTRILHAEVD